MIVEDPEATAQMQIHAHTVDPAGGRTRFDADFAFGQATFDVAVAQAHSFFSRLK